MKPNVVQVAGSVFLMLLVALFAADLVSAVRGQSCIIGAASDCYPWGTEGPTAGVWSYESKSNYLIRGFVQLGLLVGVGLFLIWRAKLSGNGPSRVEKLACVGAAMAWIALNFI